MKLTVSLAAILLLVVVDATPDECVKAGEDGSDYRGTVSVTSLGHVCQRWDSQSPNKHDRTAENYPDSGMEENYCRNPDGEAKPWCLNSEGTNPRGGLCEIPTCPVAVDGGWSEFGEWSACSAECGGGTHMRSKTCTNPSSENGGKECEGDSEETDICNSQPCSDHEYSGAGYSKISILFVTLLCAMNIIY